jgi:serine/threonine protein kinase
MQYEDKEFSALINKDLTSNEEENMNLLRDFFLHNVRIGAQICEYKLSENLLTPMLIKKIAALYYAFPIPINNRIWLVILLICCLKLFETPNLDSRLDKPGFSFEEIKVLDNFSHNDHDDIQIEREFIQILHYIEDIMKNLQGDRNYVNSYNKEFKLDFYKSKYKYYMRELNIKIRGAQISCDKNVYYTNEKILGEGVDGMVFLLAGDSGKAVKYIKMDKNKSYSVLTIPGFMSNISSEIIINYLLNFVESVSLLKNTRVTICPTPLYSPTEGEVEFINDGIEVYFLMEKLEGDLYGPDGDKFYVINNPDNLYIFLFQIAHAICCLKKHNIYHCDLHMKNIFFRKHPEEGGEYTIVFKTPTKTFTLKTNYIAVIGDFSRASTNEIIPLVTNSEKKCDFKFKVHKNFNKVYGGIDAEVKRILDATNVTSEEFVDHDEILNRINFESIVDERNGIYESYVEDM